jgi:hypothetical protein
MTTCNRVVEQIDEFLMDLLDPDARGAVDVHLQTCASCREALEKGRNTWALRDEWQPKSPGKSTRRALPRQASPPWAAALAVAGSILVLVALAAVYFGRRPSVVEEQRTAQVDVPPPPVEVAPVPVPEPARPQIERPAPLPAAPVPPPPVDPPTVTPMPIIPSIPKKEPKAPEAPAPVPKKTVAAAVARVEKVKGDVRTWTATGGQRPVTEGQELSSGERLVTQDRESQATVRLPDSAQMKLGGTTELGYARSGEVVLSRGMIDVDSPAPSGRVFSTFNAQVDTTEARFTLERREDVTLLQVRQGTVPFTNFVTGKLLQAKPGQNLKAEGHPKVDQRKVDAAVANGVVFLRGQLAGLRGGTDELELVLYTLLHGGVSDRDPATQTLLQALLAQEPQKTYNTALRAMCLEKIDRVKYQEEIWKCAQFLLDNQGANGEWGYGTPTQYGPMPKGVRSARRRAAGRRSWISSTGRCASACRSRRSATGPLRTTRTPSTRRWGCGRATTRGSISVRRSSSWRGSGWWNARRRRRRARAWSRPARLRRRRASRSYTPEKQVYGSMTAGAIGSVCIYDYILGRREGLVLEARSGGGERHRVAGAQLSPTGNPGIDKAIGAQYSLIPDGAMYYYYLYAVERTGLLFGTEKFGAREWYPEGANALLKAQQADASWPPADIHRKAVWDTCFSILFLRRATRPLLDVASEDSKSKKYGCSAEGRVLGLERDEDPHDGFEIAPRSVPVHEPESGLAGSGIYPGDPERVARVLQDRHALSAGCLEIRVLDGLDVKRHQVSEGLPKGLAEELCQDFSKHLHQILLFGSPFLEWVVGEEYFSHIAGISDPDDGGGPILIQPGRRVGGQLDLEAVLELPPAPVIHGAISLRIVYPPS